MTDYIEREALQKLFNDVSTSLLSRGELAKDAEHMVRAFLMVTEMIQDAPAADVAEVVHGKWKEHFDYLGEKSGYYWCPLCKKIARRMTDYCPNCGAKMDGGGENG